MPRPNDLSRSLVALHQDSTLIAVIELSQSSWLVAGIVPGLERQPLKKLEPDQEALLRLLRRWQDEAAKAGRTIARIAVAFEAGRDGFWLARWLRARGIEAHVIHPTSVAVSREHRRAKTDRLDTELLKRAFLGWLRGEPGHCGMAAVPTLAEEDARRPNREREGLVGERTRIVNRVKAGLVRMGVRGFKPTLRNAAERLDTLRTPEGGALPPNTLAELRRDMARLRFVAEQIKQVEETRLERLEQQPAAGLRGAREAGRFPAARVPARAADGASAAARSSRRRRAARRRAGGGGRCPGRRADRHQGSASPPGPIRGLSTTMEDALQWRLPRTSRHWRFSSLRSRRLAARLSRRLWTSTSSTIPF